MKTNVWLQKTDQWLPRAGGRGQGEVKREEFQTDRENLWG